MAKALTPYTADPHYVVYEIECHTPNHRYVGQTANYEERMFLHSTNPGAQFTRRHKVKAKRIVAYAENREEAKRVEREWRRILQRRGFIVR